MLPCVCVRTTTEKLKRGIGEMFSKTDTTFAKLWESYIAPAKCGVNIDHY
jgi:hypothetical protein